MQLLYYIPRSPGISPDSHSIVFPAQFYQPQKLKKKPVVYHTRVIKCVALPCFQQRGQLVHFGLLRSCQAAAQQHAASLADWGLEERKELRSTVLQCDRAV